MAPKTSWDSAADDDYWNNVLTSQGAGTSEGSEGESKSGTEAPEIGKEEFANWSSSSGTSSSSSSSSSSIPSWAQSYVESLVGQYGNAGMQGYTEAVSGLGDYEQYIEDYRKAYNQQYADDIQQPTMDAVFSALNSASGAGLANSSVYGDLVSRAVEEALQAGASANTEGNLWAASAKIGAKESSTNAWKDYVGMISDYLGLTEQSSSQSQSSGQNESASEDWTAYGNFLSSLTTEPYAK